MATLIFRAEILINGVNPYVLVSHTKATILKPSWRKPLPVLVHINRQPTEPWHINMMPIGNGDFYLYLHGDVRQASHTTVGDIVMVAVSFDSDYTAGPQPLPDWFALALEHDETARAHWIRLSPSRQKEIVRSLTRLKSPAAQAKNLEQLMHVLSGNDGRFMGRSWSGGA